MNKNGTPSNLKPFKAGDKRINRKGQPKDLAALRKLAQQIAHRHVAQEDGFSISATEVILQSWSVSKDPRLQMAFVEYAYGKPPQQTEIGGLGGGPIKHEDTAKQNLGRLSLDELRTLRELTAKTNEPAGN